jgi:transaldolase
MEKFKKLLEYGQSYWLDNLTREMIQSGELRGRIENEGLRGITSNPTIFQVAISKGNFYDSQISALAGENKDSMEIYEAIVIKDIQDACDLIRPVFDSSGGIDGFISLEVSPHIARDTEATKNEVRKFAKLVSRPNCFIKIPGTPESLPAIEEMLYEGININITLLFSVSSYEKVAEAFLRALERRLDEGKQIDNINSVASFFLSRIDIMVNKHIEDKLSTYGTDESIVAGNLLGEAAIASAKMAYQSFLRIFKSERWERLEEKGAHVQRPLWASTSNKIEGYRETRYFEPLIGPDTVNTLPDSTIEAIKKIGKIEENTVLKGIDEALMVFKNLETLGINIDEITNHLLVEEGIDKFVKSFDQLLATIEEKSNQLV